MGTITIDDLPDDVAGELTVRAVRRGQSLEEYVNALVRDYLIRLAHAGRQCTALEEFLAIADASHASSAPEGRQWTRDELYDR